MKILRLRFIVALTTFSIGVSAAGIWAFRWFSHPQTARSVVPVERIVPADTLITLQRTGCYGYCPSYTLTVTADGTVVFNATAYWVEKDGVMQGIEKSGVVMSKISQDTVRQLITRFEEANYFSLRDFYGGAECPSVMTDSPSAYTSIQVNGRRKAISHYLGCTYMDEPMSAYPRELTNLEDQIDDMLKTKQWMQ